MKPGTLVRLPDGREGTVVFHSVTGYGIKWGHLPLTGEEIEAILEGNGSLWEGEKIPDDYDLTPDAMLRDPYRGAEIECVGRQYEVIS